MTDHVISGSVNYPDAAYVSELVSAGLQTESAPRPVPPMAHWPSR